MATETLADGIQYELKRCRELLRDYEELKGVQGVSVSFAIQHINESIDAAETAITDGDTVAMLRLYKELKSKA